MPTLLASHQYRNINPKTNRYVNEIRPLCDIETTERMFNCFEDVTKSMSQIIVELKGSNPKGHILRTKGADA
jgi:hypothetical protein